MTRDAFSLAYDSDEQQREELLEGIWASAGPARLLLDLAEIAEIEAEHAETNGFIPEAPYRQSLARHWRQVSGELRKTAGRVATGVSL